MQGAYLVAEGDGPAGGRAFREAVAAVHAVAVTLQRQLKLEGQVYRLPRLEAVWRSAEALPPEVAPVHWHWKLLCAVPAGVDAHLVRLIKESLVARRGLEGAADVRLEEEPVGGYAA